MSVKNLVTTFGGVTLALAMGGCATRGEDSLPRQQVTVSNDVTNTVAVLGPCSREGIKARPTYEVSDSELRQRQRAGEAYYRVGGYYVFAEPSLTEKWAPLVGAVILGSLGNGVGSGTARAAATVGGAAAGGLAGEFLARQAKLERLAQESGCEAYLRQNPPAATPSEIYNRVRPRREADTRLIMP